jgi:hypothetical protein
LIYDGLVFPRWIALVVGLALLGGCAARGPVEQRTTQGPSAQQLWAWRMKSQLGREPSFDERRFFDDQLEATIARYLDEHPEDANAIGVSMFRFDRQVAVGMSQEQVRILLGPPLKRTADGAQMERQARKFWPAISPRARQAWTYPLGWTVFFGDGERVVDLTQFYRPGEEDGS